jgi:hypothetical protein
MWLKLNRKDCIGNKGGRKRQAVGKAGQLYSMVGARWIILVTGFAKVYKGRELEMGELRTRDCVPPAHRALCQAAERVLNPG